MSVSRETLEPATLAAPTSPSLDGRAAERLDHFLRLLLDWNSRINLVARADPPIIQRRHIDDSLQLLPLLPINDGAMADLGSGAGFPGLVLAISSPRPIHLIESDHRKAAFLTEAAARLALTHVTVHATRIESLHLPPLAAVTARALAPLDTLLGHAARLLAPDGAAIFPKGRTAEAEITAASQEWVFAIERFASRTDPDATILRLTNIRPQPYSP